ncbi:hypothetical protein ABMA28_003031 [Loxostege sticticalis]|uniref:Uncharacterized protein n=1 Tax=Loxostege sticticalis TaxID=481309 RepID=A0ABD0SVW9_LOXSC
MAKTRKKLTREEKLLKDRVRKREKYAQIKNDPNLYALQKEKVRIRYLARKEKKKIRSIKDKSPRSQRKQRKQWRINSQRYQQNKIKKIKFEKMLAENSPPQSDTDDQLNPESPVPDPLMIDQPGPSQNISPHSSNSKNKFRRMRYRYLKTVHTLKERIT